MTLNNHPYQKCLENDLSEDEMEGFPNSEDNQIFDQPKDSYYFTYVAFSILGITSLLPQNFFIVANEYWMYKFRSVRNATDHLNPLQVSFTSYVSVAMSVPFVIFCIINVLINEKTSLQKRMLSSLITMFILFTVTLVFVQINTSLWQNGFLALTLLTLAVLSVASAIFTSSMTGIVNKFSPHYITSFFLGQGLSGTFSSLAEIISLSIGVSPTSNGLMYFVIGCVTVLITLIIYIFLQKNLYYTYFSLKETEIGVTEFESDLVGPPRICYKKILKKILPFIISGFICLFVTLCVTPGAAVLVKSYGTGIWSDIYFIPVITFLVPNIVDCLGRVISGWTEWPKSGNVLILLNLVRICLIPMILFCNLQPRRNIPVIFDSDVYYILFNAILSFSNGYIFTITVINVAKFFIKMLAKMGAVGGYSHWVVEQHEKHTAGLMITIFLSLGGNIGSFFGVLFVQII